MALPTLFRRNQERNVPVRRQENPFAAFHRDMNRLFGEFWRGFDLPSPLGEAWGSFSPRVDVDETDTEVRVTAELPDFVPARSCVFGSRPYRGALRISV